MKAILLTANKEKGRNVYNPKNLEKIRREFDLDGTIYTKKDILSPEHNFSDVEIIFGCWGVESFSVQEIKENLPKLKGFFYVGGSVQYFAKPFLEAGIRISGAWQANAVAVAEYIVSQMILGIKGVFLSRITRSTEWDEKKKLVIPVKGFYGIKIGILGSGAIGRKLIEFLSNYKDNQLEIYLYSPSLTEEKANQLGVKKATVEEIFKECDIISNHIANNPQTFGFYTSKQFDLMGDQVVFINSGRGEQVVENDLAEAMRKRPQSCALLDVTYPEPPNESCPYFSVDNIFINPHIAGSQNNELERMVDYILRDAINLKQGKAFLYEITLASLSHLA
ncbi:MAG TPA: NAD(P)-dependent oxidoreductase [Clostridia bacterium]|nr:NAD(P)-dependent oxidoreductase [Clostridia bacterium]